MNPKTHLVLVSHGTDNPTGSALISALVAAVADRLPNLAVHESYVDVQHPQLPEVLAGILAAEPAATVRVVPLLLGTGFHVKQDMVDALNETHESFPSAHLELTAALGDEPEITTLLLRRLAALEPAEEDIVILAAAGSSDANSVAQSESVFLSFQAALQAQQPTADVQLAFLSAAEPRLKDLVPRLKFQNPNRRVLVASYLLAPGYFDDVVSRSGAHGATRPLLAEGEAPAEELIQIALRRAVQPQLLETRLPQA